MKISAISGRYQQTKNKGRLPRLCNIEVENMNRRLFHYLTRDGVHLFLVQDIHLTIADKLLRRISWIHKYLWCSRSGDGTNLFEIFPPYGIAIGANIFCRDIKGCSSRIYTATCSRWWCNEQFECGNKRDDMDDDFDCDKKSCFTFSSSYTDAFFIQSRFWTCSDCDCFYRVFTDFS